MVSKVQQPAGMVPAEALAFGTLGGDATQVDRDNPLPAAASARFFVQTDITLSAGQVAGTSPILAANASRRALKIIPSADCNMAVNPSAIAGIALVGGYGDEWEGQRCPANAIYLSGAGLSTSTVVSIWEA